MRKDSLRITFYLIRNGLVFGRISPKILYNHLMSKQNRREQLHSTLLNIVHKLKRDYQPEQIIVFGSAATGHIHEWSDLDVMIVKETQKPFLQRMRDVAILCDAPISVDYLVYTPTEVAQMTAAGNPFIKNILHSGQVVYERQASPSMAS